MKVQFQRAAEGWNLKQRGMAEIALLREKELYMEEGITKEPPCTKKIYKVLYKSNTSAPHPRTPRRFVKYTNLQNFPRPIWTKMSKISTYTDINIYEVEQKTLLTICTTKLHICYRVTLHFWIFTKKISKILRPFCYPPPFITFARVGVNFNQIINLLQNYFHN